MNDDMLLTPEQAAEAQDLINRMHKLTDRYKKLTKGKAAHLFLVVGHTSQDPNEEDGMIEKHTGAVFGFIPLAVTQLAKMAVEGCPPLVAMAELLRLVTPPDKPGFSAS